MVLSCLWFLLEFFCCPVMWTSVCSLSWFCRVCGFYWNFFGISNAPVLCRGVSLCAVCEFVVLLRCFDGCLPAMNSFFPVCAGASERWRYRCSPRSVSAERLGGTYWRASARTLLPPLLTQLVDGLLRGYEFSVCNRGAFLCAPFARLSCCCGVSMVVSRR